MIKRGSNMYIPSHFMRANPNPINFARLRCLSPCAYDSLVAQYVPLQEGRVSVLTSVWSLMVGLMSFFIVFDDGHCPNRNTCCYWRALQWMWLWLCFGFFFGGLSWDEGGDEGDGIDRDDITLSTLNSSNNWPSLMLVWPLLTLFIHCKPFTI